MKYLLQNGQSSNTNVIYDIKDKALKWAAENGHLSVVKYLLQNGQKPTGSKHLDVSNLNSSTQSYNSGLSANTNVVDACNDMAFRWAAFHGHLNVVKYLLRNGADIRAGNDSALRMAIINGHLKIVKYLVEHGANVNVLSDEQRKKYKIKKIEF